MKLSLLNNSLLIQHSTFLLGTGRYTLGAKKSHKKDLPKSTMRKSAKKVCVALSGGIDSSFCARLLKEEGYALVAITLSTPFFSEEHMRRAREFCKKLHISHQIFDITDEFKRHVIDYLLHSYLEGFTPNPCSVCNQKIKFSLLLKKAKNLGCDYLATGHYARLEKVDNRYYLRCARDKRKTQEYFLGLVRRNAFKKVLFPLGNITKEEVKKKMSAYGFLSTDESQELCFIKSKKYREFIEQKINDPSRYEGVVTHLDGTALGRHKGTYRFTYGQRTGLGISWKEPLYVIDIEPHTQRIIVGEKKYIFKEHFTVHSLNWFYEPGKYSNLCVKIRYNSKCLPCTIKAQSMDELTCYFTGQRECPAPGQVAVFYDKDRVVCAGIIAKEALNRKL